MNGEFTYQEITTQPEAWDDALEAFALNEDAVRAAWAEIGARRAVFIGCGSTHYLARTAARLFQALTGIPARGLPSSELLFFFEDALPQPEDTLLIPVSRSGTTTETLQAVEQFRRRGGRAAWTITCYPDSPLAQGSDLVLPAVAAQEQSVAQTRSFASMLVLAEALAAALGDAGWEILRRLPALGRDLLQRSLELTETVGRRTSEDHLYFLGSGANYGIASEAMLKMTEMSLTTSQAFHFLEFRHGPMSMVEAGTLMVGLLSPAAHRHELQLLHEMAARGATSLALNPTTLEAGTTWEIRLPADLPAWALPVMYLPPLQLLAYHRARAKGLDPDNPRHLVPVIYLDPASLLS